MITTITNDNRDLYNNLFEKANKLLDTIFDIGETTLPENVKKNDNNSSYEIFIDNINYIVPYDEYELITNDLSGIKSKDYDEDDIDNDGGFEINSLSDYFNVIANLSNIHPLFMRLPQDEAMFEIDANKRLIHIPSGNNVYAVKGDHSAEIIYFQIDRYFDVVDLGSNRISVLVQATCKNKNGEEKNYLIPCTRKDLDSIPDKIIFGWPIDKRLTETAGTITFSVRFFNINGELAYSLGTQPATISVVNGLDFIDTNTIIDQSAEVYLQNYEKTGAQSIPNPLFVINMKQDNTDPYIDIITLNENNGILELYAIAGEANLEYTIQHQDLSGKITSIPFNNLIGSQYYILIEDENTFNKYKLNLYELNDNNYESASDPEYGTKRYYYKVQGYKYDLNNIEGDKSGRYTCTVKAQLGRYINTGESKPVYVYGAAPVNWAQFSNQAQQASINNQWEAFYEATANTGEDDGESGTNYSFNLPSTTEGTIFDANQVLEASLDTNNKLGVGDFSLELDNDSVTFNNNTTTTSINIYGCNTLNGNTTKTSAKSLNICKPIPKVNNITISQSEMAITSITFTFDEANYEYNLKATDFNYSVQKVIGPSATTPVFSGGYNDLINTSFEYASYTLDYTYTINGHTIQGTSETFSFQPTS